MYNCNPTKPSSLFRYSFRNDNICAFRNELNLKTCKYKLPKVTPKSDHVQLDDLSIKKFHLKQISPQWLQKTFFSKSKVSQLNFWANLSTSSNLEKTLSYIQPNKRPHYLFDQIRLYSTFGKKTENKKNLTSKMRAFLGLESTNSPIKVKITQDLENFQNNLNKENLKSEDKQKMLLSFVEGYLVAKENQVFHKPPTRTFTSLCFSFIVAGTIVVGIYLFLEASSFFKSPSVSIDIQESSTKFTDVKGAYEAKEELKNVVEFLKNPEKFLALGGKLPKGVLLVGPPGTGKTLLAKAVAGEAGVPFFCTSGSEFDEVFVGIGAKRVRELFKLAKENIPCVIFIDEIDSIGKERTSNSHYPHANDTINQLLTEMDGFRNTKGIIVLGATNRKDDLDKALLRPGRFDVEVSVSVPDYKARKELLEFYLNQVRHQNVNVEKLARGTTNFTGADIENMVNQAALKAAVSGAQYVTTEHLEYARDKTLMGPESISKITDPETNRITAYHEGGHALVAYFTEHSQPIHKVTIIARGSSLGHTAYIPDKDIHHITKAQLLAMLDAMMGGRAAEELVFGTEKVTSGAASDLEKATELASKMVKRWGMSDTVGLSTYGRYRDISPQTSNLIDMEIKQILKESYERAKSILIAHKEKHKALSEALLKYETLEADEITAIMKDNSRSRFEL